MNHVYLKQQLELAIKKNKMARIDYVDTKMNITRDRLIEPYEINHRTLKNGDERTSVTAQCYLRNDLREFDFDGIQKIEITSKEDYGESNDK